MSQTIQQVQSYEENVVSYTGTTADIAINNIVCATGLKETDGTAIVVRPATAHLTKAKYLVVGLPANVNEIVSGTTRRGGLIRVIPLKTAIGTFTMTCGVVAADAYVGVADGSFLATSISDSSNDTIAEQARYIGQNLTDLSGGAGNGQVHVGGF